MFAICSCYEKGHSPISKAVAGVTGPDNSLRRKVPQRRGRAGPGLSELWPVGSRVKSCGGGGVSSVGVSESAFGGRVGVGVDVSVGALGGREAKRALLRPRRRPPRLPRRRWPPRAQSVPTPSPFPILGPPESPASR